MCSAWCWNRVNLYVITILSFVLMLPVYVAGTQPQKQNRFTIYMWPYKTDVLNDYQLYKTLGIKGIQIDRGKYQQKRVEFAKQHNLPYYVGHFADKGILYLKESRQNAVINKRGLATRPLSLADPETIQSMKLHIQSNLPVVKSEQAVAYALDDEISLGSFTNPCDVDKHPLSIQWFQRWLAEQYISIDRLNEQWGSRFQDFDSVMPTGYDQIRKDLVRKPMNTWNLSSWMDFRQFMDFQFSFVLADLVSYTNGLDPDTPAGFVGGQEPSPWGGYDYARLEKSVQWMEAYDLLGTNELLRSWWQNPKKIRMQTFFSSGDWKEDAWFFWYYMFHGNQGVIAWPDKWFDRESETIAKNIQQLGPTFKKLQGDLSRYIVDSKSIFSADPIGIYYSHPSIQAGWAMDAVVHEDTWPKRKSSIDQKNQSKGILRVVWSKVLEDLGYQYDFISYLDVRNQAVDLNEKYKVIILPKTLCLSKTESDQLTRFVQNGGCLIADYLCGVLDEHGRSYGNEGVLDHLFGVQRNSKSGFLDGDHFVEIDAEKYQSDYLERLDHLKGAFHYSDIPVYERETVAKDRKNSQLSFGLFSKTDIMIQNRSGRGRTVYLNLCPLEYFAYEKRYSAYGDNFRNIIGTVLSESGMTPRVKIYEKGSDRHMIESIFWENGKKEYLCLVKNPIDREDLKKHIEAGPAEITIEFRQPAALVDLDANKHLGVNTIFVDRFIPWEGKIYEVSWHSQDKPTSSL